jgi:hypothetical protein
MLSPPQTRTPWLLGAAFGVWQGEDMSKNRPRHALFFATLANLSTSLHSVAWSGALVTMLIGGWPSAVLAQSTSAPAFPSSPLFSSAPVVVETGRDASGRLLITPALCRALGSQIPSADYQPNVDVRGRPVVPADLPNNGAAFGGIGNQAEVRLFYDPRNGNVAAGRAGIMPEIEVGRLLIDTTRGGAWNNQPLPDLDRAALRRACAGLPPG